MFTGSNVFWGLHEVIHVFWCVYRQWYISDVFTGGAVLSCLQVEIFWCVYRQWLSDVFTGGYVSSCLQVEIFWCIYGSDVLFTCDDTLLCLQVAMFCCVYRRLFFCQWWYSVVFTEGDILLCLQAVALTDSSQWLSFDAARDYCRGVGGDLVSIHSAGENSFVQNLVG